MSKEQKANNKIVVDLTRDFLDAVMTRKDWHPFAQLRVKDMKAAPNIPTFTSFKVLRAWNPGHGIDPEQTRAVFVEITLGGNDRLRLQAVEGRLLVIRECDWEICATCGETGHVEDGDVCSACTGTGRVKVDPPRVPTKGTDTYEHDVEHGKWGVCPTSFEFIPGTQKRVEG